MNVQQAGTVDLGAPLTLPGVAIVLNLGHSIHSVVAKGFSQVVCVCVRIVSVKTGICFSRFPQFGGIVVALPIPRPEADSKPVLAFIPKRGFLIMRRSALSVTAALLSAHKRLTLT